MRCMRDAGPCGTTGDGLVITSLFRLFTFTAAVRYQYRPLEPEPRQGEICLAARRAIIESAPSEMASESRLPGLRV